MNREGIYTQKFIKWERKSCRVLMSRRRLRKGEETISNQRKKETAIFTRYTPLHFVETMLVGSSIRTPCPAHRVTSKLKALVYDILPQATTDYTIRSPWSQTTKLIRQRYGTSGWYWNTNNHIWLVYVLRRESCVSTLCGIPDTRLLVTPAHWKGAVTLLGEVVVVVVTRARLYSTIIMRHAVNKDLLFWWRRKQLHFVKWNLGEAPFTHVQAHSQRKLDA